MTPLSCYILTKNSEKYLNEILEKVSAIADEILIIDSGSTDSTKEISSRFYKARFIFNAFENFKAQRLFAEKSCTNNMVLFLDSDEIPNEEFLLSVNQLKKTGFKNDAYSIARNWIVLGKKVRCIYPVVSPDYPIRLYNKLSVSFTNSQLVHEAPTGYINETTLHGAITHITFETEAELNQKLDFYTNIAAQDLLNKRKNISLIKLILNPITAFIKWYFIKGGFKDGSTGVILGKYAYSYTLNKYQKARKLT